VNDAFTQRAGDKKNLKVLDNDVTQGNSELDEDTLRILVPPAHDVNSDFEVHDDHVHYRPRSTYSGPDSFTYEVCNFDGFCDVATVFITVEPR
jgi:hypothetical protein